MTIIDTLITYSTIFLIIFNLFDTNIYYVKLSKIFMLLFHNDILLNILLNLNEKLNENLNFHLNAKIKWTLFFVFVGIVFSIKYKTLINNIVSMYKTNTNNTMIVYCSLFLIGLNLTNPIDNYKKMSNILKILFHNKILIYTLSNENAYITGILFNSYYCWNFILLFYMLILEILECMFKCFKLYQFEPFFSIDQLLNS